MNVRIARRLNAAQRKATTANLLRCWPGLQQFIDRPISTLNTSRLDTLRDRIRALPPSLPPDPWKASASFAVGGLSSVGFARDGDLLLVVSSQGRGVFDGLSGERVARDTTDYQEDALHLEAQGIGPLQGQTLRMAGAYGGGLALSTSDGWSLHCVELDWPGQDLVLVEPGSHLFGELYDQPGAMRKIQSDSPLRAFGFSATGRSLVIATHSELHLFSRAGG